jgi:hypothetical protein
MWSKSMGLVIFRFPLQWASLPGTDAPIFSIFENRVFGEPYYTLPGGDCQQDWMALYRSSTAQATNCVDNEGECLS